LRIEQTLRDKLSGFCTRGFRWQRLAITGGDFDNPDILGFAIKGNRQSKAWRTKHQGYLASHGDRCVEVDALSPEIIRRRVRDAIEGHIDQGEWSRQQLIEAQERESVRNFVLAQKDGSQDEV
jgi:hypothetical protein